MLITTESSLQPQRHKSYNLQLQIIGMDQRCSRVAEGLPSMHKIPQSTIKHHIPHTKLETSAALCGSLTSRRTLKAGSTQLHEKQELTPQSSHLRKPRENLAILLLLKANGSTCISRPLFNPLFKLMCRWACVCGYARGCRFLWRPEEVIR